MKTNFIQVNYVILDVYHPVAIILIGFIRQENGGERAKTL